jgi:hypothetical protein
MDGLVKVLKRTALFTGLGLLLCCNSGCSYKLLHGLLWNQTVAYVKFFQTTPIIPVTPYFSQLIEDTYIDEERYSRVPVLDPVEGENAPLFCMDPPSSDEVMRALPDETSGGVWFLAETFRNNVRIQASPIVDKMEECRFYPLVGPARMHKCHYKCTVHYDKIIRSDWPVPFYHKDQTTEVVYIDHDHLIRCAGPASE